MSMFQSRNAFRPRDMNVQQNNVNSLKPTQNIKNILGLKNVTTNVENIAALKQQAARDMTQSGLSKIPVFRSRIPLMAANQKENKILVEAVPTGKVQQAKSASSTFVMAKPTPKPVIENIDKDMNCFLLSEYAADIYEYLREVEQKQNLQPNFLAAKNTVAPHMRAILINWLISAHNSFHLASETLYICVSILDRYFAREAVPKNRIQLVGATALFIASKYEEIYYPEIGEFVAICDKLYTKRDIIKMELEILGKLKFELGRPLPLHFLRRGSKAAHADGRTHMLAKYLCELALVDYDCAHWHPSVMAATALYISLRLLQLEADPLMPLDVDLVWTPTIEHYTGYSRDEVLKHAAVLCRTIVNSENSKYQHCRKKYSTSKFMEISKLPQLSHKLVKRLANSAPPSIAAK